VAGIFEKLRLRYPMQWERRIGVDEREIRNAMDVWAEVLHDLTVEELMNGFRALDETTPPYPPSVMEFKRLCRSQGDKPLSAAHRPFVALPKPKADKATALRSIEAMRRAMARRRPT